MIDGQAPFFVTMLDGPSDQFRFRQYSSAAAGPFRVRLVDFKHSVGVTVADVTLLDSTSFHLHFINCSRVLAERVTVRSDLRWPNCDGIDVTSCNDTVIRGCDITTGDDAISPKTWQGFGPLTNLLIEDTVFHARSGGIHFGASAWYDCKGPESAGMCMCVRVRARARVRVRVQVRVRVRVWASTPFAVAFASHNHLRRHA